MGALLAVARIQTRVLCCGLKVISLTILIPWALPHSVSAGITYRPQVAFLRLSDRSQINSFFKLQ